MWRISQEPCTGKGPALYMGNRFSAALGNADPWKRDLDNDSDRHEEEKVEVVYTSITDEHFSGVNINTLNDLKPSKLGVSVFL